MRTCEKEPEMRPAPDPVLFQAMRRLGAALLLGLALLGPATILLVTSVESAHADDDDDGGIRDDDDDDDGAVRPSAPVRTAPPLAPTPPPPVAAPDEIVTLSLTEADLATLLAQGFDLLEEADLAVFDGTLRRLRIPPGTTLAEARDLVRAVPTGQDADLNHFYRSENAFDGCAGSECPARRLIGWPEPPSRGVACGGGVSIGMIDTGINGDHETFAGADLKIIRLSPDDLAPSEALHGTAVAALLVGDPATRSPGLVPGARLVAVDAFHRSGTDERADVFTVISALDTLSEEGASVINLSLAGPPNEILSDVVTTLSTERDTLLVAAVGNDGPNAEAAYPAAYPEVLAVTAVDRSKEVYRRAIRGDHVDLAAPGVNVWTAASISGARLKTGTSFAVPFVAAAAALLRGDRPDLPAAEISAELQRTALDLGPPGRDRTFGAGLLSSATSCVQ